MIRRLPPPDRPLLGILAGAAALRLYGLGASSLWTDEARVMLLSLRPIPDILIRWPGGIEPPLSYLLQRLVWSLGTDEATLRLPAALASLAAIWLTYRLGERLFSRRVGLLAAALLAISPLDIRYAQEARYYTLFSALFLLSTLSFCSLFLRRRGWPGYIIGTALAGWTQIFAGAVLATQALSAVLLLLAQRLLGRGRLAFGGSERKFLARFAAVWCLLGALLLVGYGPTLWQKTQARPVVSATRPSPIKTGAGDSSPGFGLSTLFWDVYYRTFKWFTIPSPLATARDMTLIGIPPAGQWPFRAAGALVLIGLVGSGRERRPWAWLLAFQMLFLLTSLALLTERFGPALGIMTFAVRRMLFLLPLHWLLVALGATTAGEWLTNLAFSRRFQALFLPRQGEGGNQGRRPLGSIVQAQTASAWLLALACCGTVALSILPGYYRWRKDDWRGLAAFLKARAATGEAILCCDSWQTDPTYEWAPLTFYLRDWPWREELMYVKGAEALAISGPTAWYISYAAVPAPHVPGYEAVEHVHIGPHWLWVSRLARR